jgi:uncharacterized protein (DUF433 family)
MSTAAFEQPKVSDRIREISSLCCESHPAISVDEEVLGGIPHIAGTRLSVGQILGRIYVLGNLNDVVEYYGGNVTVDQIKQALVYAQDLIESLCEPSEDNGR